MRHVILLTAVLSTALVLTALTQPTVTPGGFEWDGLSYRDLALQLARGAPIATEAPFVYRLGVPALSALLAPDDPLSGFRLIGIASTILAVALMDVWLGMFDVSERARLVVAVLFVSHWIGPLRMHFWQPGFIDPTMHLLMLCQLIALECYRRRRTPALAGAIIILAALGSLVRESLLLVPALILLIDRRPKRRTALLWLAALGAGLAVQAAIRASVTPTANVSDIQTLVKFVTEKFPARLLLGLLAAFGPVAWLAIAHWRVAWRSLPGRGYLFAIAGGLALASWVMGNDTERIFFWAAPVVYLALAVVLDRVRPPLLTIGVLAIGQLLASRVLVPTTVALQYASHSFHMSSALVALMLVAYGGIGVLVWFQSRYNPPVTVVHER